VFGGWMVVDTLVLSFMHGTIHPYYCLSLAPAVAGMFAIGVHEMWRRRESRFGRAGLAALILVTGVWSWWILHRNGGWLPPLRWTILAVTVAAAVVLLTSATAPMRRRMATAALAVGILGALAGSAAYAIATIGQSHAGGNAMVGPAAGSGRGGGQGGPGGQGHPGGFGQDADNPQLDAMLRDTQTRWSAAIDRSSAAAGLELSTDTAVMAIGGFTNSDPVPTLSQFQADVANHQITYYIAPGNENDGGPGGFGGPGRFGAQQHADIANWVAANFKPVTVGSDTLYDLAAR
jgi:4-amino-4-deoxy-L-arabinose transferase-like glycosyltransferase